MNQEIYFHGEIQIGKKFDVEGQGLCCELTVVKDQNWEEIYSSEHIQTQISYKDCFTEEFVWSHFFSYSFQTKPTDFWPVGLL